MTLVDILFPSCALFLDFDGTMVDIAPQPQDVHVPSELIEVVAQLRDYLGGAVAVISGRPIEQIDDFLSPLKIAVAGVHGTERRGADGPRPRCLAARGTAGRRARPRLPVARRA